MKIEHTTYDQTHGPWSARQRSASQKMLAISPTRPRRRSEKHPTPADEERPVTIWPGTEASHKSQCQMTTFLMLERRLEKEARKAKLAPRPRSSEAKDLRSGITRQLVSQPYQTPPPPLRRKPNFSESLRECLGSPKTSAKKREEEEEEITKAYTLRDAIRAGKLERVIPPPQASRTEGCLAPPQPPIHSTKLTPRRTSRSNKTASASSKVAEFIDRGTDILDETRKELAGKLLPSFEHLNYPSFSRTCGKSRRSSDASSLSFCCIGEDKSAKNIKVRAEELQAPSKETQAFKTRQRQSSERLSGQGTNPWSESPPAACRLCRKPGVRGIRGLCNDCEADIMRSNTRKYEFHSSSDEDENEIKPTPPLKDFELLTTKKAKQVEAKRKFISQIRPNKIDRQRPQGLVRAELKMTSADSYPQIITPAKRQNSREAMVEGDNGDDKFRSWQTPQMRAEYERTKYLFKKWSDCYEKDRFENFEEKNESVPLVYREDMRPGTARSRDSNFYGFYDDILKDHGIKMSSSRRA